MQSTQSNERHPATRRRGGLSRPYWRPVAVATLLAVVTSGCATVIHGTSQKLPVTVQPAGAEVRIYRWNGELIAGPLHSESANDGSPGTHTIPRPKRGQPYLAVASSPGYCPKYFVPETQFSGAGAATAVGIVLVMPIAVFASLVDNANGSSFAVDEAPFQQITLEEEPCGH